MPAGEINKGLVRCRFCRSLATYDANAVVQRELAAELCDALERVLGRGARLGRVLELGCGTGLFTRMLLDRFRIESWVGNDIACGVKSLEEELRAAGVPETASIHADMETCDFAPGWDLICANASFQWLADPLRFVGGLHRLLVPAGLVAYATFGPDNLGELAAITGHGLRYATLEQHREALAGSCDVLAAREFHRSLLFESPRDVLRHFKATGTNAVSSGGWGRRDLARFIDRYEERFATNDGHVRLTYHPMLFVARKTSGKGAVA